MVPTTVNQAPNPKLDLSKLSANLPDPSQGISNLVADRFAKKISDRIFNGNAQITVDGNDLDHDSLTQLFIDEVLSDNVNVSTDEVLSTILHECTKYPAPTPQNWRQIIANTYLLKNQNPLPTKSIIYTFDTDISQQAMMVINNDSPQTRSNLKCGLLGNLLTNPLSNRWKFVITNNTDYVAIQKELATLVANSGNSALTSLNQDIQNINLNLKDCFTTWITGASQTSGDICRQIDAAIAKTSYTGYTETLPLNANAIYNPIGYSFINISALATVKSDKYRKELSQLTRVSQNLSTFKIKSFKKIRSASSITANQKQNAVKQYTKKSNENVRRAKARGFSSAMPTAKWQIKRIAKIISNFKSSLQSNNSYKTTRTTFMRPNRRHPNDPNLRGTIQRTAYRPDVHIFLDSSGSISESQYKAAITTLITLTKKLNTNLYFTSFADTISQPVLLATKNRTIGQIYRQFRQVPKVGGGTEYENVWNMIDRLEKLNQSHGQAPQLNFMITDFEYDVSSSWIPRLHQASTLNTYYMPLAADQNDYDYIKDLATEFANELIDDGDITVKSRFIM